MSQLYRLIYLKALLRHYLNGRSLFRICMQFSLFIHVKQQTFVKYISHTLIVRCMYFLCGIGGYGEKFCVLVHGYGFESSQVLRRTKKIYREYSVFQDEEEDIYFPDDKDHINSFSYLIIDPYKRHVTILHHKYAGGIW